MTTEEEIQTDDRIEALLEEMAELSVIRKYLKNRTIKLTNEIEELKGME